MSLETAAKHLASKGRGPDTQLVHMSLGELNSLQELAKAHGGSLSINPDTGLPEAGFLSSILPMVAGAALSFVPGVGPLMAAGLVGGGTALASGNLSKGLMAGLGAFGGAGLAGGLANLGTGAISQAAGAGLSEELAQQAVAKQLAETSLTDQLAAGAKYAFENPMNALKGIGGGSAMKGLGTIGMAAAPALMGMGEKYEPPAAKPSAPVTPMQYSANPVTPTPQPDVPGYGDLGQDFGRQQRYFDHQFTPVPAPAPAPVAPITTMPFMAAGGPVEAMSDANAVGANTGYPMANISRGAYATPYQQPIPQSVVTGPQDTRVDAFTGQERMAGGGITGSGELNLNIPLDFGGGAVGGFGQGPNGAGLNINQGPLDLGQRNTGFGQAGVNGYTAAGSGAGSGVSITGQPLNSSLAAPFGITTQPQNPFNQVADQAPGMLQMARDRGNVDLRPRAADLERNTARDLSFDEFKRMSGPRHPGDRVPTEAGYQDMYAKYLQDQTNQRAELGGLRQEIASQNQQNTLFDRLREMQAAGAGVGSSFAEGGMARGGVSDLGDYSDGGRLLRGPGDGVSDSIPAMIGSKRPARLADGEFVVPARIVSELGNGSTEAGARKLYAMMNRVQQARGKTTGKGKVAKNTRAEKYLPA